MMLGRQFLLMHITTNTGHHRASRAIESTLKSRDCSVRVSSVDASQFTSRIVRWAIARSYYSLIHHQPDVWEYLYDNPAVYRRIQFLQALLHRYHSAKFQRLLEQVRPDVIACTQAYPCAVAADFKKRHGLKIPLVGILTDHAPHLYWFHEAVDVYVVPSEQVKQRFVTRGVAPSRVRVLGIPIDPEFSRATDSISTAQAFGLDLKEPIILIMGGGGGFGRIHDIVTSLDSLPQACQLIVLTGTNQSLLRWLNRQSFRHRVVPLGYVNQVSQLMDISTLLISKPGGLTISEALVKHLPVVIVNPIPGQEAYNARYLLSQGAAVEAGAPEMVRQTVRDLLDNPDRLTALRQHLVQLAHPHAAEDIADLLFQLAGVQQPSMLYDVGQGAGDAGRGKDKRC